MADIDLGPLLAALAQDASRRSQLADPARLRRAGERRRLGKAAGVGAALTLVMTGTFGLMTGGHWGGSLSAAGWEVAEGTLATLPTVPVESDPAASVVVPPAPTWHVAPPVEPPTEASPAPTAGPPAPSSTERFSPRTHRGPAPTTTVTTTVTVPPAPPVPPVGSPSSPDSSPTTPPATTGAPTSPITPPPTTPTDPPPAVPAHYEVWLTEQVGGRIGFAPGSGTTFGDPAGTLPYSARVATMAMATELRAGGTTYSAAVGVDTSGQAHLTYFAAGKVALDHVLDGVAWGDASAIAALEDQVEGRITVLAFRPDGTVVRQVVDVPVMAAVPSLRSDMVVLQGLSGVTAATHARHDPEVGDMYRSMWTYVVSGDKLLLLRVAADGTSSLTESVPSGMAGTTTLARVVTGVPGAGGVAAWSGAGAGRLFAAKDAFGPLTPVGDAAPLPR